jgi:ribosomal protein L29
MQKSWPEMTVEEKVERLLDTKAEVHNYRAHERMGRILA